MPKKIYQAADLDALSMFIHAERFTESALVLSMNLSERREPETFSYPIAVLASFAMEIYLKVILVLEGAAYEPSHDLEVLFDRLSPLARSSIEAFYDNPPPSVIEMNELYLLLGGDCSLRSVIAGGKNAFVNIRYRFEPDAARSTFLLDYLLECVRQYVLDLRQDFPQKFTYRVPEGSWKRPHQAPTR